MTPPEQAMSQRTEDGHVAVGQHQWYHLGVGAPPILVYFSGDWDVHWGVRDLDPWPCHSVLCALLSLSLILPVEPPKPVGGNFQK